MQDDRVLTGCGILWIFEQLYLTQHSSFISLFGVQFLSVHHADHSKSADRILYIKSSKSCIQPVHGSHTGAREFRQPASRALAPQPTGLPQEPRKELGTPDLA